MNSSVFPSLLKDVVPILSHSSLPLLEFPHGSWTVVELSNTHQVNHRFDVIMNHRTMTNPNITVAFDMEWPVNLETGIHGLVSLIQVAYQNTIYLIKVSGDFSYDVVFLTCLHDPDCSVS